MSYNLNSSIQGGNIALSSVGLTGLSGGATTYSTSATALTYLLNGIFGSKAQVSGGTTPTTDAVTGQTLNALVTNQAIPSGPSRTAVYNGSACTFAWGYDGTNYKVVQGPVVPVTDNTSGATVCPIPQLPDTLVPVAVVAIKMYHASTVGSFRFGTDNWNTANVTVGTVQNVGILPVGNLTI